MVETTKMSVKKNSLKMKALERGGEDLRGPMVARQ